MDLNQREPDSQRVYLVLPEHEGRAVSLVKIIVIGWERKWTVIAGAVIGSIIFGILAFTTTPVFRAETVLAFQQQDSRGGLGALLGSQLSGLAGLAGMNLSPPGGGRDEAIAVLTSRQFLQQFIEEQRLMPLLFPDRWSEADQAWIDDGKPEPSIADGVRVLGKTVMSVSDDRKTGLITLRVDWRDRELAAHWANLLVEKLNDRQRQRAIAETQLSIGFLEAELRKAEKLELQQGIYRLLEAQVNTAMLASIRRDFAFRVIDPAVAPPEWQRLRPRRSYYVIVGWLLGGMLGFAWVLFQRREDAFQSKA